MYRGLMLLSEASVAARDQYLDLMAQNPKGKVHLDLIKHFSVRLGYAAFAASGVIVDVSGTKTLVLTAAHNVGVYAGNKTLFTALDKTQFAGRVRVIFGYNRPTGNGDETENITVSGAVSRMVLQLPSSTTAHSDLAMIVIDDLAFRTAVDKYWLDQGILLRRRRGETGFFALAGGDHLTPAYSKRSSSAAAYAYDYTDDYHYIQAGYGRTRKGDDNSMTHSVQLRHLAHKALIETIAETHDHITNVATFESDDTFTTQPGDSGGPLFAVKKDFSEIALVGVTLGANYYSDRTDDSDDIDNNAVNVLTPGMLRGFESQIFGE